MIAILIAIIALSTESAVVAAAAAGVTATARLHGSASNKIAIIAAFLIEQHVHNMADCDNILSTESVAAAARLHGLASNMIATLTLLSIAAATARSCGLAHQQPGSQ